MTTLLLIDSSARQTGSHSRSLSRYFKDRWTQTFPDSRVISRDLAESELPHLDDNTIKAFYGLAEPGKERTPGVSKSDELIEEVMQADVICLASPMYNFSVSSLLKVWIDLVVRSGKTYRKVADGTLEGMCRGKTVVVLSSSGGLFSGSRMDHLCPYIDVVLGFMGITDVEHVMLEGMVHSDINHDESRASAHKAIDTFINAL
ncbi:FMN-dependent NADH-azoreductase [Pseudomonas cavernicola]|uniref:FMN dependent NADH:quinone oxidoreductase n=1 Tax=Pseudomonas cavernicola TaxID=2320866 RepID=A0A418XMD7_9PSED|nr:NAD(P)H-dependent oxidoreductase [Pseudomonas cavernicola]RJG13639.1 FMN-dependent NADH-azoreductase [Pseudomonas cavernicola]